MLSLVMIRCFLFFPGLILLLTGQEYICSLFDTLYAMSGITRINEIWSSNGEVKEKEMIAYMNNRW